MKQDCAFVIASGPLGSNDFFRSQIDGFAPVELICADGGARHLDVLGMKPQVIIGDMDSLSPDILKRYEELGSRIMLYPRIKNETDTQLALEYAWKLPLGEVRVYAGMGGRIDHTLANISLLITAAKKGIATKLVDE